MLFSSSLSIFFYSAAKQRWRRVWSTFSQSHWVDENNGKVIRLPCYIVSQHHKPNRNLTFQFKIFLMRFWRILLPIETIWGDNRNAHLFLLMQFKCFLDISIYIQIVPRKLSSVISSLFIFEETMKQSIPNHSRSSVRNSKYSIIISICRCIRCS